MELIKFDLTPTKANIDVVSSELTLPVINGNIDAVEFSIRCAFWIECLTKAKKDVQDIAINNVHNILGAKVEVVEAGTKYDYSQNENWNEINNNLAPFLLQKKDIEDKIKMATKIGNSIIDENSGEIIASPVKKESTTTLKITLGK